MITDAYREGKRAYQKNEQLEDNPYDPDTKEAVHWAAGWMDADALKNRQYVGLGSSNTITY